MFRSARLQQTLDDLVMIDSQLASPHLDHDEDDTFDVAIVGAGMVGLALAGELGEFF